MKMYVGITDYDWYITLEYIDGAEITNGKLQNVKAPKESEEVINSLIDILNNYQE